MKPTLKLLLIATLFSSSTLLAQSDSRPRQEFGQGFGGGGRGGGHRPPELTTEQKTCLDKALGVTSESQRPEPSSMTDEQRAKIDAAFASCNIERPKRPDHKDHRERGSDTSELQKVESIENSYLQATTDDEKQALKTQMKEVFYASKSEQVKERIRKFFNANQDTQSKVSSTASKLVGSAGVR